MKFQLKPDNRNASDEELLEDLSRAANQLGLQSINMRDYNKIGRFNSVTIANRFHGWNAALKKAGLKIGKQFNIPYEELISDIKRVAQEISPLKLTQKIYNEKGQYTRSVTGFATPSLTFCKLLRSSNVPVGVANPDRLRLNAIL